MTGAGVLPMGRRQGYRRGIIEIYVGARRWTIWEGHGERACVISE